MSLNKIMVALDNMSEDDIFRFLDSTQGQLPTVKIGLEMFCKLGPDFIQKVYDKYKTEIFLDLKLHDIPNTVAKSIKALNGLPIKFLTIHLSGGKEMIEAAIEAAKINLPQTQILGVSFLTSLDAKNLLDLFGIIESEIPKAFERLFSMALKTSIHGVVLSAQELSLVNNLEIKFERKLTKVCPGIRFIDEIKSGEVGDQKRVLDPATAFRNGANYLVIGRSLAQSKQINLRIEELKTILS